MGVDVVEGVVGSGGVVGPDPGEGFGDVLSAGFGGGVREAEGAGVGGGDGEGLGEGLGAGGRVSTAKLTVLSASEPSLLALLAASVKASLATEITPLALLFVEGVKVAV